MTSETNSHSGRDLGGTSPWGFDARADRGEQYAELVARLRELQDVIADCAPSGSRVPEAYDLLDQATALLRECETLPDNRCSRSDISGRKDSLVIPVRMRRWDEASAEGVARFSPFHHGAGGGVHGGAIALLFDDFIGRLANGRFPTRTAYLHINYRAVSPIQQDLLIRGRITSREGRKMFLSGELLHQGKPIADCEGLWIILSKGIPVDN